MNKKIFCNDENPNDTIPEEIDDDLIMGLGLMMAAVDSLPADVDEERVELVELVCEMMRKLVDGQDAVVNFSVHHPLRSCGSVTIMARELTFENTPLLVRLASMGDDFEVLPRTDDRVELVIGFEGLTKRRRK